MRKPSRTISGVAPLAIMWEGNCPGKCIYCPDVPGVPKSYTGLEPAARRALRNKLSPEKQVRNRLNQYEKNNHNTEKIDMIIMGGTFTAAKKEVQKNFVKKAVDALNNYHSRTLKEALTKNETAPRRLVGLTIETRPDYIEPEWLLKLGATKVELGVQSLSERILEWVERGHGVRETVDATKRLKEAGFKICYHVMPGLGDDEKTFERLFGEPDFRPDMLKIYPVLIMPGTKLYKYWKEGKYKPPKLGDMVSLLSDFKTKVPPYVRIIRIQRDIPSTEIEAGIKYSNLRQYVWQELENRGKKCKCIRCREAGRVKKIKGEPKLKVLRYPASGGMEYFISFETDNAIIGFLRLRFGKENAFVRELHIYGRALELGEKNKKSFQHRGYGKKLLKKAEEIAKEKGYEKLKVISGAGVRQYYRKRGYMLENMYMVKKLKTANS